MPCVQSLVIQGKLEKVANRVKRIGFGLSLSFVSCQWSVVRCPLSVAASHGVGCLRPCAALVPASSVHQLWPPDEGPPTMAPRPRTPNHGQRTTDHGQQTTDN